MGAIVVDHETRTLVEAPDVLDPVKPEKNVVDWRAGPTPAYGALKRGCATLGLSVNGLYAALRRGDVVVDERSHEFVHAPIATALEPTPAPPLADNPAPTVRDRRACIIGDVERYLDDLARVDLATAQEFGHALVNRIQIGLARRRIER